MDWFSSTGKEKPCVRCGIPSAAGFCAGCKRDISIYIERVMNDQPICSTCSDKGHLPWITVGCDWDTPVCPDCPACFQCARELRLHKDGNCPSK